MRMLRICSFVFLIIGLSALGYADEHFPFTAQVKKESVNIRAGANTNFEKLDKLSQGAEVVVLGKSYDWYKVQLPTTSKAYIRADYLKITQGSIAEAIGNKVNIRATASSESASLGLIKNGDLVKVIAETNGWWQIEPPAQAAGWIREDFLSIKSETVGPALIRGPIHLEEQKKIEVSFATVEVKGRLMSLTEAKGDAHYELLVNGKMAYYVQSVPNIDRFRGAMVLIKGLLVLDNNHHDDSPVLRTINISLLL